MTDTGVTRSVNQDSVVTKKLSENCSIAVLCDGMGGANGGEVASQTACSIVLERFTDGYEEKMEPNTIRNILTSAVSAANAEIFLKSKESPKLAGMGTTCVIVVWIKEELYIINIGDSRAYIFNGDKLSQVTTDHSIVQVLLDRGEITKEDTANHPDKNLITRAVGVEENVLSDYIEETVTDTDLVLLCSDGLTNMCDDNIIASVLALEISEQEKCQKLIDLANEYGGKDNISVAIISSK